jgi:hypothetical protein
LHNVRFLVCVEFMANYVLYMPVFFDIRMSWYNGHDVTVRILRPDISWPVWDFVVLPRHRRIKGELSTLSLDLLLGCLKQRSCIFCVDAFLKTPHNSRQYLKHLIFAGFFSHYAKLRTRSETLVMYFYRTVSSSNKMLPHRNKQTN